MKNDNPDRNYIITNVEGTDLREWIDAYCKTHNTTKSELMRELLWKFRKKTEKEKIKKTDFAHFIWGFGVEFFLEVGKKNYIWYDPDKGGNNTIVFYEKSLKDWYKQRKIPFARSKGRHRIKDFCGKDVKFLEV